ncbi:DUF2292 domain-containing protein [Priestia megaterium]|uniref:DUF2292 domain-containing protein n=2 Tax=Bacillaceae TaxID=186817 RepID=UPI0011B5231A|nr:DUF2292 domain-containing protein [Priestia megaterium]MBD8114604.1 YezD family protein [Priestia megaterium]QDZ88959.1 DUF2292 domain-containing protein [Priestia megaterium]
MTVLENIQYGSLNITIHNGEITQVDCSEKHRFRLPEKQFSQSKESASLTALRR